MAKMNREMAFCPECNNMLCPREDRDRMQLMYFCRRCEFKVYANKNDSEENCVDRLAFNFKSKEDLFITSELGKDPTLGRKMDWCCRKCGGYGAVFYQLPERIAQHAMTLVYVCLQPHCTHWEREKDDDDEDDDENKSQDSEIDVKRLKKQGSQDYDGSGAAIEPEKVKEEANEDGLKGEEEEAEDGDSALFGEDLNPALRDDFENPDEEG